jgi:hypothetical protein
MANISFQQAFALSKGVFISPSELKTFVLEEESNPGIKVSLSRLVNGQTINLNSVPALVIDSPLNLPNQVYILSNTSDLVGSDLSYKFGASFDGNLSLSDTEKFYHITGQKLLKKLK